MTIHQCDLKSELKSIVGPNKMAIITGTTTAAAASKVEACYYHL